MAFQRGYLALGRFRGAAVRVHWSAPVGAFFFGQLRFVPGFWLAFVGLILLHELGHAWMVKTAGARVRGIDVTGLGGECRYDGAVTPIQKALIAWGGVLAQLAVLVVAGSLLLIFGSPQSAFLAELVQACVFYNLMLVGLNLLPFAPLDGHEAWKLVPLLRARWKASRRLTSSSVGASSAAGRAVSPPLPRLHDAELEVHRLRKILEASPRRR